VSILTWQTRAPRVSRQDLRLSHNVGASLTTGVSSIAGCRTGMVGRPIGRLASRPSVTAAPGLATLHLEQTRRGMNLCLASS